MLSKLSEEIQDSLNGLVMYYPTTTISTGTKALIELEYPELPEIYVENTKSEEIDRMFYIEQRMGFSFSGMPRGQIIFMFDDANQTQSTALNVFRSHNMVFSVALPSSHLNNRNEDGRTAREVAHDIEGDGGEILSHSTDGTGIGSLSAEEAEYRLKTSLDVFRSEGFNVQGWVSPYGQYNPLVERAYRKYYRYGYQASSEIRMNQYRMGRPYLSDLRLSGAKALVDTVAANMTVQILYGHLSPDELALFSWDDLNELLSYIASKDIDVTTYRDCYCKYGDIYRG